jgi:chromosome segregation ATPase
VKNQKAAIRSLEASVQQKEKEIKALKVQCKESREDQKATFSSLRVAEKTLISMKGELSSTRRKLRDSEEALARAKAEMETQEQMIAAMKSDLESAAKDKEVMTYLMSSVIETQPMKENQPTHLRDQLKAAVEMLNKENKEMRALTNYHSEKILNKENTIAELTDTVSTLQNADKNAQILRAEWPTSKNSSSKRSMNKKFKVSTNSSDPCR